MHIRDGATDFTMSLPSMVGTPAGCPPRERFYTGFGPASLTGAVTEVAENPSYQISFAWIEMLQPQQIILSCCFYVSLSLKSFLKCE